MPRYNTCPETAITKASKKLYPGIEIKFNPDANNDEQCDLNTLFSIIPGDDFTIDDPKLGGRNVDLRKAAQIAEDRASREVNIELDQVGFVRLFETYKEQELASIMPSIESILIKNIQNLDPNKVYILRTGKIDEGGHFHTLYYEGNCWMLDSGYKDGPAAINSSSADESQPLREPNIGVLYNTETNQIGPMSKSLIDISSEWGRTHGKRMISIYEINRDRMLIAAHYLEKFRALSKEETQEILEKDYLNEIISQPHYLEEFGQDGYWHASSENLDPVTSREYIHIALEQCKRDLSGAVIQLENQGFFENIEDANQLFIEMIVANNIDVVKEILQRKLVDLSNPATAEYIYKNAFLLSQKSEICKPGLNQCLRILQNELLTILNSKIPFNIQDVCLTLNHDALGMMLTINPKDYQPELETIIYETAEECGSKEDTYMPLIETLEHFQPEKPKYAASEGSHSPKKPGFFNASDKKPDLKTRLRQQKASAYNEDELALEILKIKADTASKSWEIARDILLDPKMQNKSNPLDKKIEYTLTSKTGKELKIQVSEPVQIAMDELYARKLDEEEHNSFRM